MPLSEPAPRKLTHTRAINSCHVYKDDSEAVCERWPQFYTGRK